MKHFSFDEVELINSLIENGHKTKSDFLIGLEKLKSNADDPSLSELCNSLIQHITQMTDKKFESIVETYPISEFLYY